MVHKVKVDGADVGYDLLVQRPVPRFSVDGRPYDVHERPAATGAFDLVINGRNLRGWRVVIGDEVFVRAMGRTWIIKPIERDSDSGSGGAGSLEVRAEMPGTVVAVHAAVGDKVAEGDRLLTIESMKLQMTIVAHRHGRIATINVRDNETFERGAALAVFAAEESKE